MKPSTRIRLACLLIALPVYAAAQPGKNTEPGTHYSLYQGAVKFSAPSNWPAIMQKTEGTPQFVAFQVRDPADQGSGEASQVSVEAKVLNDASTFPALVNAGSDKAKQMPGYEARSGDGANVLHYLALNGKQRYEYRETWYLDSKILIHVRCARPLLAATTAEWTAAYDAGCAQVTRTAKPH
ncbi:MAG: hypothetical protein J0I77_23005 [Rudaea sp.]|uniref:hypothetical protein n=1 Tax=unclassified Rudaea TaxID=2627037 RepID=UPI0010F91CC4|nr:MULTISPECIES: hypothetical protein [unclassified Rudaea]MBN8888601.1 hypothetical protein [Rudaea sp.]MBR0346408.1 hypothetical protein [Rudaea sp.]